MRFLIICLLFISVLLAACGTQKRIPYNYIENVADTTIKDSSKIFEPVIQKTDLLYIQVYTTTTLSLHTDSQWNLPINPAIGGTQNNVGLPGYLVDQEGNIEYPHIGIIHVEGLTKKQLSDLIKSKIPPDELKDPSVIIRFMNFRVLVLGEVGHPGVVSIPYEKVTIFEAIGLAGDIPITGKKTTVRVIREANGTREYGTIDLTSKDLFASPYYHLMQNDVVIVEPRKSKLRLTEQSIVAQRISLALTVITAAGILYNIFK
jgi:polysaccharide export outer membrane protein